MSNLDTIYERRENGTYGLKKCKIDDNLKKCFLQLYKIYSMQIRIHF